MIIKNLNVYYSILKSSKIEIKILCKKYFVNILLIF